ncbi:MAG: helix-turn-helix domain-containing protein [Gracilibacteraceae bacterium]|nr:helix-turn-helix domain-containing protein [Gracilibacteraceae bacterium]
MKKNAVRRSHQIIELLAAHPFDGMSNSEIAKALDISPANVSRDLKLLQEVGYAVKKQTGWWGLTDRPLQILRAYSKAVQTMQEKIKKEVKLKK